MKTIKALSIENLRLPEEMAFYYFVINAVTVYSIIANKFAQAFAIFKAAYDYQNDLYKRHDRKILTQEVQEKEAMRDKWFRKLRNNINEVVEFGSGVKLEAAKILATIFEEYGGAKIPDMKMESETGVLINLYEDLQGKYADQLELLSLTPVVASAKQANDEFIEAQNARLQSDVDYGKGKLNNARPVTAKKYRYFIDSVNLGVEVDEDGELEPFIDYMNAKIDEMRKLANQPPSSAGSGSDGENVVIYKTATFKYFNDRIVKLKLAVGAPIIAEANTEGYYWVPTPPEFMPNKNLTFKEEPIAQEEGTATFHFLDHSEEIIRQIVGTPLVGPANTVGCVWMPAVPGTMPAGASSFFEELQNSSSTLFTVTWLGPNNEVLHVQEYEAGQHIVPPEPPAGYIWNYHPNYMPEENLVVNCLEDE